MLTGVRIEVAEQHRLRIDVEVEEEHDAQAEAQRLGVPAGVIGEISKQLLDEYRAEDRQGQCVEESEASAVDCGEIAQLWMRRLTTPIATRTTATGRSTEMPRCRRCAIAGASRVRRRANQHA
jgi:hypothetical protein